MKTIKHLAKDYNINILALKRVIKENGFKLKSITKIEILELIYINAPDLLYCREDENKGTVEYLDINLNIKLCYEIRKAREVSHG